MTRAAAIALSPVLAVCSAGTSIAAPVRADIPHRTEAIQTIQDPVGDAGFARGDIESASATAPANGMTAATVVVRQYESPMSDNWQLALTDVTWDFDVDGDGELDAYAIMIGVDDEVIAGVFDADDELLCEAAPSSSPTLRSYSVTFPTSCLGNPPSYWWGASMTYEDHVSQTYSIDSAPDAGWAGPVANDAYVPCAAGAVVPGGAASDGFVSLVPARLLDTRPGQPTIDCRFTGAGRIGGVVVSELEVAGRGGVPVNATAVVLNVTVTDPVAAGFVTAYPCGSARPLASNLNYLRGSTIANAVIATIGAGGKVCLFSNADTHLIVDVNGYFTTASSFVPFGPGRSYESRGGLFTLPRLAAGSVIPIGVPGGGSSGVFNVTITDPATAGFATVFPCGSERPLASNLNFQEGDTVANSVIAKAGTGGTACVYLSTSAHLIVDAFGYFEADSGFTTVVPARLLETRSGASTVDGAGNGVGLLSGPVVTTLPVAGRGTVPTDASAAVLNVTVVDARAPGFVTVFPCDSPQPLTSSVNYLAGSTVPNLVISKIAANGTVCLYTNAGTHMVVDVNGYFPAPD